jgi:hypothetical protein
MPLVWATLIGLAAFRLYRITGRDEITLWFHGAINAAARKNRVAQFVNDLISCAWCVGFWYCLALSAAGWLAGLFELPEAALIALAASAVAGLIEQASQAMQEAVRRMER